MNKRLINDICKTYSTALCLLNEFDNDTLTSYGNLTTNYTLEYEEALRLINILREKENSKLFGQEKDDSFKSSINAINQTFDSMDLYPTIEEKAAHLLYFIVKNHSFIDGNKRIGTLIFLYYLYQTGYIQNYYNKISNELVVSLTIMIAVSDPKEKERIIKLLVNILK